MKRSLAAWLAALCLGGAAHGTGAAPIAPVAPITPVAPLASAAPCRTPAAAADTAGDADAPAARDRGFLWRARKDGRTSFLYGTLHVGRRDWTRPGPKVTAALQASDTVALELDLLDPQVQRQLRQGLVAGAPGTPYPTVASLPPELRARLQRFADAACLPPETAELLSPVVELALLTSLSVAREGLAIEHGIDESLNRWGRRAGMPVTSLESVETQLAALLPAGAPEETLAFVSGALDDLDSGRARTLLLRTARVWAAGDWAALNGYAAWCECLKTPADRAEMARLLDARNPGLADAVDALHAAGRRVFAAVGSLHLIGPTGLPALLARRGYRVERIAFAPTHRETPP